MDGIFQTVDYETFRLNISEYRLFTKKPLHFATLLLFASSEGNLRKSVIKGASVTDADKPELRVSA